MTQMLVLEIPDWVIFVGGMLVYVVAICSLGFDITIHNWRKKIEQFKWWVLDKYSNYRYKHIVNFTIGTGTNVNAINTIYNERYNWIAENIENCERTTYATGARIEANMRSYESVEPTRFAFKFKHKEDLMLFVMRWS